MQIKRNYPLPELPIREGMSALRNIGSLTGQNLSIISKKILHGIFLKLLKQAVIRGKELPVLF